MIEYFELLELFEVIISYIYIHQHLFKLSLILQNI